MPLTIEVLTRVQGGRKVIILLKYTIAVAEVRGTKATVEDRLRLGD